MAQKKGGNKGKKAKRMNSMPKAHKHMMPGGKMMSDAQMNRTRGGKEMM